LLSLIAAHSGALFDIVGDSWCPPALRAAITSRGQAGWAHVATDYRGTCVWTWPERATSGPDCLTGSSSYDTTSATASQFVNSFQYGHLTLDTWNHVTLVIGAKVSGKTISRIDMGQAQPASGGG
jgi:hypothetical protein